MCNQNNTSIWSEQHSKVVQNLYFWGFPECFPGPALSRINSSAVIKARPNDLEIQSFNVRVEFWMWNDLKTDPKLCEHRGICLMAQPAEHEQHHLNRIQKLNSVLKFVQIVARQHHQEKNI